MKIALETPFKNKNNKKFSDNYFYTCAVARRLILDEDEHQTPLFFHALYTQFLSDNRSDERNIGLKRSFEFHSFCDTKLYAIDRGLSQGMFLGGQDAIEKGINIKFFTSSPDNHELNESIKKINNITNNKERWLTGVELIKSLEKNEEFIKHGYIYNYHQELKEEIKEVKDIIKTFFMPIIKECKVKDSCVSID